MSQGWALLFKSLIQFVPVVAYGMCIGVHLCSFPYGDPVVPTSVEETCVSPLSVLDNLFRKQLAVHVQFDSCLLVVFHWSLSVLTEGPHCFDDWCVALLGDEPALQSKAIGTRKFNFVPWASSVLSRTRLALVPSAVLPGVAFFVFCPEFVAISCGVVALAGVYSVGPEAAFPWPLPPAIAFRDF